jgi:hypothetical protein
LRLLILSLWLLPLGAFAQHYPFSLQRDIMLQVNKAAGRDSGYVHMGAKPIQQSRINLDLMDFYGTDNQEYYYRAEEILLSDHLLSIRKKDFEFFVDPLFNFEFGDDFADSLRKERSYNIFKNTRGLRVQGTIAKKVSFVTTFYENQAVYPNYANEFANSRKVSPGHGRIKFGDNKFDYSMASGIVIVAPTDFLTIQYGHDKNFIGHGYRSVLLSDNSFNYPHLKVTWNLWKNKLQYSSVFGKVESLQRLPAGETPEAIFQPKGLSFNYLSFMPWRFLEIGLFEGFVWKMYDSVEGRTPFNPNSINPVIMVNTAAHGLNHENNGLIGLNLRAQITQKIQFYGQLMLDDASTSKYGFQAGAKWFDVIPNLELQAEFNSVTPFTYGTANPLRSFTHNNEYFAHPLGAGFNEFIGFANYRWGRFFGELKLMWAGYNQDYITTGTDPVFTHFGKDILRPETQQTTTAEENKARHMLQDLRISYVVNPSYNLMINGGITNRHIYSDYYQRNTTYIYIGIRTYIHNQYFDF